MKNLPFIIAEIKEKYPLYKELKTNFTIEKSSILRNSDWESFISADEYEFDVEKKQLFKRCFMINSDSYYKLKLVSNSKLNKFLETFNANI
jgi:hypothetical protein